MSHLVTLMVLSSFLLLGMTAGQTLPRTRGFTAVPNNVIRSIIQRLRRQPGVRDAGTARPSTSDSLVNPTRRLTARIVESLVGLPRNEEIKVRGQRNPSPLTPNILSPRDALIARQQPIDQIIEQAETNSTLIRLADRRQLRLDRSTVLEGDIVMDETELLDMDQQIRLDELEEQIIRQLPGVSVRDTAFRDRIRALLMQGFNPSPTAPVRRKRAARRTRRWPGALIPVRIASSGFTRAQKNRIAAAMNEISEKTCVCFDVISRTQALQGVGHVRIVNGNGCRSRVGRRLRRRNGIRSQDLTLAQNCRNRRVATHEFLHAVGLYHEQSRPDRNDFVRIVRSNVERGKRGNFRRYSRARINSFGIPYDYRSIMHYSSRAFSRNNRFTVIPRPQSNRQQYIDIIGKATEMSTNDARAVNRMYSCSAPSTPNCADYPYRLP